MTMDPPTPDELGPLLSQSAELDMPLEAPEAEDEEFMAAARMAVGGSKATALKDAIEACLRGHGLIGGGELTEEAEGEAEPESGGVGEGFEDY